MTIQIEFYQAVGLLIAFLGFALAAGKLLLGQIDRRLTERFTFIGQQFTTLSDQNKALAEQNKKEAERHTSLERDLMRLQADLPLHYVRRDDYVRNQTVIEAKLDALALKFEKLIFAASKEAGS